jgi:hypothetical protein
MKMRNLFLTMALALCSHIVQSQVTEQDSLALVALYNATNGPAWVVDSNWLTTAPVGQWHGVTVEGGRVTEISMHYNNLDGPLPAEIGDLTAITALLLCCNALSDTIPPTIGNLTQLENFVIETNNFSGSFPAEIANCQNLRAIIAYTNNFTGTFPMPLLALTSLQQLHLGNNQFTGSIPGEINQLTALRVLELDRNEFSGVMPSLKDLTNLVECHLAYNNLSGDIGDILSDSSNIYYTTFDGNQFTGCYSETLFRADKAEFLNFSDNEFDCLGDFSAYADTGVLKRIICWGNRIPFEYLEPNRHVPIFTYAPAKTLLDTASFELMAGDTISIESGSGGLYTHYQWFHDGDTLQGQTGQRLDITDFQATDQGMYHCEMTNDSLPDLTHRRSPVTLILEGTSGILNTPITSLEVYPNPAGAFLTIPDLEPGSRTIIYDVTGKVLKDVQAERGRIDISALPAGQFIVHVTSKFGQQIGRFVKTRN